MKDEDDREPPRRKKQHPSALARLIPMVGLFQSGLADWRSASDGAREEQAPADEEPRGGKER